MSDTSFTRFDRLADGMPGGFFVYRADAEEKLLYANQVLAEIFGCKDVAELMEHIGGSFRGLVHPEDYAGIEKSIDGQIKGNDAPFDTVEYRIVRKDGAIRWLLDYGRLLNTETEGSLFFVFVADITEKRLSRERISEENQNAREYLEAIQTLGSTYNYVYKLERRTKFIKILHGDSDKVGVTQALAMKHPYETAVEVYIERNVYFDDREMMRRTLDFDNICHQLEFRPSYRQGYRVFRDGELHHYGMKAVPKGEDYIYLSFSCEDEMAAAGEAWKEHGTGVGRRSLLVIEDNELNRGLLCDILSDDYEVLEAENGEVGLRLLEQHVHELSAILLDLQMPVMDGYEFMEHVQHDVLLSSVPVIVMTADHGPEIEGRCLQLGAVEFLEKPYNEDVMLSRIRNMIRIRENAADMHSVEYDELTGLYTRQAFYHYAEQRLKADPETDYSLMVTDVDDFKLINSVYGEATGDQLLKRIAENLREQSKHIRGVIAHYDADRFVTLYRAEDVPDLHVLEQKLMLITSASGIENLSVRVGLYEHVDRSLRVSQMCDRAMSAMNSVKHHLTRHVGTWDGPLATRHRQEQEIEAAFAPALANREFEAWYQPKYEPSTDTVVGAEALVRWRKPDGSMVSPGAFIPLFEKDGLVVKVDEYIFRRVCEWQAGRMAAGKKLVPVSINMSRLTLHHPGTVAAYKAMVEEYGIPFSCVPIEITESSAFTGTQIRELMNRLKEAGFVLHMDDFGSGYSSLASLAVLPFDVIKLDKSLADNLDNRKGRTIIRHVIDITHGLGMTVVAEGVETKEQCDFLRAWDCDAIQGYFYSRPLPQADFEKLL